MHSPSKVSQKRFLDNFSIHLFSLFIIILIFMYIYTRYDTTIIKYFFCIYKFRIVLISPRRTMRVMRIKYSWLMKRRAMFCTDIKKKKEKEMRANFANVKKKERFPFWYASHAHSTNHEIKILDEGISFFFLFFTCEAEERRISLSSFSPFERKKTPDRIARVRVLFLSTF